MRNETQNYFWYKEPIFDLKCMNTIWSISNSEIEEFLSSEKWIPAEDDLFSAFEEIDQLVNVVFANIEISSSISMFSHFLFEKIV